MDIWKELRDEGIDPSLLEEIQHFRAAHPVPPEAAARIPVPQCLYYGKEVWESAAAALLCGQHLLLAGPKATGKNVLAENLAAVFGRPVWDVSMYVNVDAAALIGADTLQKGEVVFREGPICRCARLGGFGVLDEVNMAKNEALAVLHATLDHRRVIDVPGYERITLDDATRFIGTMNYGYAGTRELNEAMLRQVGAQWLVTKDSGTVGGTAEKLAAARDVGARCIVVARPAEGGGALSLREVEDALLREFAR